MDCTKENFKKRNKAQKVSLTIGIVTLIILVISAFLPLVSDGNGGSIALIFSIEAGDLGFSIFTCFIILAIVISMVKVVKAFRLYGHFNYLIAPKIANCVLWFLIMFVAGKLVSYMRGIVYGDTGNLEFFTLPIVIIYCIIPCLCIMTNIICNFCSKDVFFGGLNTFKSIGTLFAEVFIVMIALTSPITIEFTSDIIDIEEKYYIFSFYEEENAMMHMGEEGAEYNPEIYNLIDAYINSFVDTENGGCAGNLWGLYAKIAKVILPASFLLAIYSPTKQLMTMKTGKLYKEYYKKMGKKTNYEQEGTYEDEDVDNGRNVVSGALLTFTLFTNLIVSGVIGCKIKIDYIVVILISVRLILLGITERIVVNEKNKKKERTSEEDLKN